MLLVRIREQEKKEMDYCKKIKAINAIPVLNGLVMSVYERFDCVNDKERWKAHILKEFLVRGSLIFFNNGDF